MKVIELLTKIANGEESDTITEFEFNKSIWNFFKLQDSEYCIDEWLLNQEIVITKHKEIIEEGKKIEKLKQRTDTGLFGSMVNDEISVAEAINKQANYISDIVDKINEIIDYLEENK